MYNLPMRPRTDKCTAGRDFLGADFIVEESRWLIFVFLLQKRRREANRQPKIRPCFY